MSKENKISRRLFFLLAGSAAAYAAWQEFTKPARQVEQVARWATAIPEEGDVSAAQAAVSTRVPIEAEQVNFGQEDQAANEWMLLTCEILPPAQSLVTTARIEVDETAQTLIINEKFIDMTEGTPLALTYGRPMGGWGSLGLAKTVGEAISLSEQRAAQTSQLLGQEVAVVVNPRLTGGSAPLNEAFVTSLIQETANKNYYVMLDVATADLEPVAECKKWIDKYLISPNVFFDLDVEFTCYNGRCAGNHSGYVTAAELNEITEYYFRRRTELGFDEKGGGIFVFYIWDAPRAVQNPEQLRLVYTNGVVTPVMSGFGSFGAKQARVDQIQKMFSGVPVGALEFQRRHGGQYDTADWKQFFQSIDEKNSAFIFGSF